MTEHGEAGDLDRDVGRRGDAVDTRLGPQAQDDQLTRASAQQHQKCPTRSEIVRANA